MHIRTLKPTTFLETRLQMKAVRTCTADLPEFISTCDTVKQYYDSQKDQLTAIYKYILDLSCERMTKLDRD